MQPVQPLHGGFSPRGPIRPPSRSSTGAGQSTLSTGQAARPSVAQAYRPPPQDRSSARRTSWNVHEDARGPRVQLKMQWRTCSSTWWQRWWLLRSMQLSCAQASRTIPSPHQGHAVGRVAASAEGGSILEDEGAINILQASATLAQFWRNSAQLFSPPYPSSCRRPRR